MRNRIIRGLVLAGCVSAALGWKSIDNGLTLTADSRLWIEGTSNVKNFKCTSKEVQATVDAGADAVRAVLGGEKAVTGVQLTVAEKSLDCGSGTMNGHMLEALKTKEHPDIGFKLVSYDLAAADSGRAGTLNGVLTINGVDKTIALPVKLTAGSAGELRVTGKYELDMKDYGVKPPSLMLGTMRVGEKVTVNFDLLLKS
jgi:polyisoprenoid-binding protein YceI